MKSQVRKEGATASQRFKDMRHSRNWNVKEVLENRCLTHAYHSITWELGIQASLGDTSRPSQKTKWKKKYFFKKEKELSKHERWS